MIPFYENKFQDIYASDAYSLTFQPHLHNLIECIYVADGEIEVQIGQTGKCMRKGEMAVIFPNVVHSYHSDEQHRNFCELFFYPLKTASPLYHLVKGSRPESPFLSAEQMHREIPGHFHEIVSLYKGESQDLILIKTLMELILIRVRDQLVLTMREHPQTESAIEKAVTYFMENFRNEVSLEETAKYLGVNRYYLSHVLNDSLGMSVPAYINNLRIDYARNLLSTTDLPISRVAMEIGYENLRTFNRCFRKVSGCTPKEYRSAGGSPA